MKRYTFGKQVSQAIDLYGSQNLWITPVALLKQATSAHYMTIEPRGVVGYHQAVENQLFCVVSGSGWVRGEDERRFPIEVGQAAYWVSGEWHESGSNVGMTVFVLEGPNLKPSQKLDTLAH